MKYLILLALTIVLFACKKEEVPTFSDKNGIAFYFNSNESDSIAYTFALNVVPQVTDTIYVKMRVVGKKADFDRVVKVEAAAGTTARKGIDYDLPEVKIPAGKLTIDYPVIVRKTPEMATNTYHLKLNVIESNDFILGATGQEPITATLSATRVKIAITDRLEEPTYWATDAVYYFGAFSEVKFRFMIRVTGLTNFSESAIGFDGTYNLPVKLRNELAKYEAVNGPLMDEHNIRVTF